MNSIILLFYMLLKNWPYILTKINYSFVLSQTDRLLYKLSRPLFKLMLLLTHLTQNTTWVHRVLRLLNLMFSLVSIYCGVCSRLSWKAGKHSVNR